MEKKLSEITRKDWIKYTWIDVSQFGDGERYMVQGFLRTPEEAFQAKLQWDQTADERDVEKGPDIEINVEKKYGEESESE